MVLDANGVGELEWERYFNPDNSIFWTTRKYLSEVNSLVFVVLATNLFFLVRFFYQHYVLKPIALSYKIRKSFVPRFLENGWYSLYYISFFCFGTYVYLKEEWSIFPTMNIWLGWPAQPFTTLYRTYYLLELSFYLHVSIALFFETRRKDFYQMLTHHITTFFLVGTSYWYRYHRIGLAILWIHNISDIFLYSAKAINYIQKETKNQTMYMIAEMMFVLFAVTFFIARLLLLPFVLIRSTLFEAFFVSTRFPLFYSANVALVTLLILHLFWFYLILRIVYSKFKSGKVDDIRSDSEEEESTPKDKIEKQQASNGLEAEKITKHKAVANGKHTSSPQTQRNIATEAVQNSKGSKKTN